MRVWMALVAALMPVLALAQPVPPDFTGVQYIDDAGCVYRRDGDTWAARRDPDGAQVCGFPPSSSARRDSDTDTAPSVDERLQQLLAEGLRDGELRADRRSPEPRAAPLPDPQQAAFQQGLAQQVAVEQMAKVMAAGDSARSSDLCARLGYQPVSDPAPIIGADVTQGLCPGMRAPVPQDSLRAVAAGEASRPVAQPAETPKARTVARQSQGSVVARRTRPQTPAVPVVEMIAANARYVQIGAFADADNVNGAVRKLSDMGYRVAQSHVRHGYQQKRLVMAGPFSDRQALVRALNHLRRNGYPGAVAR